jgi:hypothetical protein
VIDNLGLGIHIYLPAPSTGLLRFLSIFASPSFGGNTASFGGGLVPIGNDIVHLVWSLRSYLLQLAINTMIW